MPPKRTPGESNWAYDHDDVGGTKYCFHWDLSRGRVTNRDHGLTGWINCTAAYAGDIEVGLGPLLSKPVRAHLCSEYPCRGRWGVTQYRPYALPQPSVHLLECDAPNVLGVQPLPTAPAALPPPSSSSAEQSTTASPEPIQPTTASPCPPPPCTPPPAGCPASNPPTPTGGDL